MAPQGTDIQSHRTSSCTTYSGRSSILGSPYFTSQNTYLISPYTQTRPTLEFPAVPYGPSDFHCDRAITDYNDITQVTKGYLVGLTDLNTEREYVRDRIASYLVDLLSLGISGFRIDAAKHIGPQSMAEILRRVKVKMGGSIPPDFLVWLEILMGGEAGWLACDGGRESW